MDTEQLKQVLSIAENGTLSAAAEKMHFSQSTLSRSVRRLEEELGVRLFDRTKNSMTLSESGRALLPHLKATLADADALCEAARQLSHATNVLRIGSCSLAPLWRLIPIIAERAPELHVKPDLAPAEDVLVLFSSGRYDMAILPYCPTAQPGQPDDQPSSWPDTLPHQSDSRRATQPHQPCRPATQPHCPESQNLRAVPLMTERLYATFPRNHAMSSRKSVSFAELDGMTFLIYAGAGYWKEVCAQHMPKSRYVVQDDYVLFSDLAKTSPLPGFITNVSEKQRDLGNRVAVPIDDDAATATFFMIIRAAENELSDLFEWLSKRVAI